MPSPPFYYMREYWFGDSRDGFLIESEGCHFFKMTPDGQILEAYEVYEREDGGEVVTRLDEFEGVHWLEDLGFEDLEVLEPVSLAEFSRIRRAAEHPEAV